MRTWAVPAGVVLLAALALYALAWQLTRQGIDRQARAKAAQFEAGRTPWDWQPHDRGDLVAGRVFGQAEPGHDHRGLVVRSHGQAGYELGVPLPYPVDLRRYPGIRLDLDTESPTQLSWAVRARLDGPLLVSAARSVDRGPHALQIDLRALDWHTADGGGQRPAPARLAMVRLLLSHPANTIVRLRGLHWRAQTATLPLATPPWPAPGQAAASLADTTHLPVIRLGGLSSVEGMLGARDRLRATAPAAIVVASAHALDAASGPADGGPGRAAAVLTAYLLLLVLVVVRTRRKPPGTARSRLLLMLQAAVCAGPSLAWAVGLHGHPDPGPLWLLAMVLALLLASWLAWRGHGSDWAWLRVDGRLAWRDWAMPLATVVLAALLLWASGMSFALHGLVRAPMYLGWAALQQILMLAVLAPRLQRLLPIRWLAALAVAGLFALAHTPNALLMELTLLAELLWALAFLKRPVLLPVILAHACAGLMLGMALEGLPLRSLEIGSRFLI